MGVARFKCQELSGIVLMDDCAGAKLSCELRCLNPSAVELQLLFIHLVKEKENSSQDLCHVQVNYVTTYSFQIHANY